MGQIWKPNPSGVHRVLGQRFGQCLKPTRGGGVERYKASGLGTTVEVKNHHQSGGVGSESADAGGLAALQVCLGTSGAQ